MSLTSEQYVTGEWLLVGDVKARVNTPSRPELVPRQYGMYWSCWSYPNLHGGKASGNKLAINLVWFNLYSAVAYTRFNHMTAVRELS